SIYNTNNEIVGTFKSFHDGMGKIEFIPNKNMEYYALIESPIKLEKRYVIPKAFQSGISFSTVNHDYNQISIYSSSPQEICLEISNENGPFEHRQLRVSKGVNYYNLNFKSLPKGILKYSIKNNNDEIEAERLVFANYNQSLDITIKTNKEQYQLREKVELSIETKDKKGKAVPANLSLSIANNKLVNLADDKQDNIASYLLMSSELKGEIYEPNFYFKKEEEKAEAALDLVMLTNGWRSYITQYPDPSDLTFEVEGKNYFEGQCLDYKQRGIYAKIVVADYFTKTAFELETDSIGRFRFRMEPNKSYNILSIANGKKKHYIRPNKKSMQFHLRPGAIVSKDFNTRKKELIVVEEIPEIEEEPEFMESENITVLADSEVLDEIVVAAYGMSNKARLTGSVVGLNISDANYSIQGVNTIYGNSGPNGGEPLYVIDGIPVTDPLNELNFNVDDIESIGYFKNADFTDVYLAGEFKSNTNRAFPFLNQYLNQNGNSNISHYSFYNTVPVTVAKTPYIPKYESIKTEVRNDFRTTLYWNPVIQTDENGKANISFYTNDEVSSFIINAEGIDVNGSVGMGEKTIGTYKPLNLDFKCPKFLSLNDTIELNVIVVNEESKSVKVNLEIIENPNFKILGNSKMNAIQIKG
ncbi:MAG: alpha-2-macroglobulin family protein, partial [Bacteroidota bacterium]